MLPSRVDKEGNPVYRHPRTLLAYMPLDVKADNRQFSGLCRRHHRWRLWLENLHDVCSSGDFEDEECPLCDWEVGVVKYDEIFTHVVCPPRQPMPQPLTTVNTLCLNFLLPKCLS